MHAVTSADGFVQAFKKLSTGLSELADTADSFASKTIPGLLRTAPNLTPNLKHVKAMFQTPEDSKYTSVSELGGSELVVLDADELVPRRREGRGVRQYHAGDQRT